MSSAAQSQLPTVFTSWKEISSYLGKSIRTVQRWERDYGLPVLRPNGKALGVVSASRAELDVWWASRWSHKKNGNGNGSRPADPAMTFIAVADLEQMMLDVMAEVRPKQSRVRIAAGRWYDLRLTPYRTADNRIDGVVLSIPSLDYLETPDPVRSVTKPKAAPAKKRKGKKKIGKGGSKINGNR